VKELPTLAQGATGADVRSVQGLLTPATTRPAIDGIFGLNTNANIWSFQAAHGLDVDGIVGLKVTGRPVTSIRTRCSSATRLQSHRPRDQVGTWRVAIELVHRAARLQLLVMSLGSDAGIGPRQLMRGRRGVKVGNC